MAGSQYVFQYVFAALVLMAAGCGGAVNGDGSGGGPAAGGNGGGVSVGGAGSGTGGSGGGTGGGTSGSAGVGGSFSTGGSPGTGGTTSVEAGADAAACGVIRASDYNQSCTVATDCALVFEGNTCTSICSCPNTTINRLAVPAYHPVYEHPNVCLCAMLPFPSCVSGFCTMCPPAGCPVKDGGVHD